MVTPDRSIVFPAMDHFSSAVRKASGAHPDVPLVIDMRHVSLADFSTAYVFEILQLSDVRLVDVCSIEF